MCGIAGIVDLCHTGRIDRHVVRRMADRLAHRGPDSRGFFDSATVSFGFTRLAIIDLESGDQPLHNEDRTVTLVCNGEIFNHSELRSELKTRGHTFRTRCDVEVILHLYEELGVELLHRLDGQFAFAIYDHRAQTVFLARDHFGINPLYYCARDQWLAFASEIKALLEVPKVPREVNLSALDQVLEFPGIISPATIFQDIESLRPGHFMLVGPTGISVHEYWDVTFPRTTEPIPERSESELAEQLGEALRRSVKRRLNADVPIGMYLSGGLDSSLIAALATAADAGALQVLLSMRFPDQELSESKYQNLMAEYLKLPRAYAEFDTSHCGERLKQVVYHTECPIKETFDICALQLSERARNLGLKVVLAGEGADELFAGYVGYRFDAYGRAPATSLDELREQEIRAQLWGDASFFYEVQHYPLRQLKEVFYSEAVAASIDEFDCTNSPVVNHDRVVGRAPLHQRSYLDLKLRLADHLLSEHGDRMLMANSVEGRYPFLSTDVVDVVCRIPPELHLRGLQEKYILKQFARNLVPSEIINREKFGYRAPGTPALLQAKEEWVNDLLSYDRIKRQGYFSPDFVEYLRRRNSEPGFRLHPHLEPDLLMIVITFGMLIDLFGLPSIN